MLNYQNIFDEIETAAEETISQNAIKYQKDQALLQKENQQYQQKNQIFLEKTREHFNKHLIKIKNRLDSMDYNFDAFEYAYKQNKFISDSFPSIDITDLCKQENSIILPRWFEGFKQDELEKAQKQLDIFASQTYSNMMNESKKSKRKALVKEVKHLINELEVIEENDKLPIMKICDLQRDLEELQIIDATITDMCVKIMKKAQDQGKLIVKQIMDFTKKLQ